MHDRLEAVERWDNRESDLSQYSRIMLMRVDEKLRYIYAD